MPLKITDAQGLSKQQPSTGFSSARFSIQLMFMFDEWVVAESLIRATSEAE